MYRRYQDPCRSTGSIDLPRGRRAFFGFFKRRKAAPVDLRPGAMTPEALKAEVNRLATGTMVEIQRIGYDGTVDDVPILVELLDIGKDGFSGRIVNVERKMIEANTTTRVYAKQGGGVIHFAWTDGDIKEIIENNDADMLAESRDTAALREVIGALDIDDRVLVAYYDAKHRGTVNVEGLMTGKGDDPNTFSMVLDKINNIELDNKVEKTFHVERDLVIDVALH